MQKRYVVMTIYLIIVIYFIFLAFNFKGSINSEWTIGLFLLTLPWSMVSIVFAWALIHGAGLGFFAVMYFVFACLNCVLIELIARSSDNNSKNS